MPRYKLTLEYDGGPFAGWQRQDDVPTVQGVLEAAAEAINGAPVTAHAAGRTDAGVHALGQVAHVDLEKDFPTHTVRDALNQHMRPHPVAVLEAERVGEDFHARFSAKKRHYLYRLVDRRPPLTLDKGHVWRVPYRLDAEAMHQAAQVLVGQHDFTTFRDSQCQADSPVKTLEAISVSRVGAEIHLTCRAISFLHRQVRSMTGSLVEVGSGKWSARDLRAVLDAADRQRCGPVAPPDGLYLTKVDYEA